jgi:Spy/CpxP family protein refolding chaperone
MTATVKRITLGLGATVIALGVTAGVYASGQNTNQDPPPFRGGAGQGHFGGPGGPGGPGRGGPGGPMGMLPMLGPKLGLTDAQTEQIKAIGDSHRDEWKGYADRARTAHEALNAAVTADTLDEALIRSRSAEVGAVDADMNVARARVRGEVFQILTDAQKTQLKTMQAQMKQRGKNRRAEWRGLLRDRVMERLGL